MVLVGLAGMRHELDVEAAAGTLAWSIFEVLLIYEKEFQRRKLIFEGCECKERKRRNQIGSRSS